MKKIFLLLLMFSVQSIYSSDSSNNNASQSQQTRAPQQTNKEARSFAKECSAVCCPGLGMSVLFGCIKILIGSAGK